MLILTYKYADPGFCRVYYSANKKLYCLQDDGSFGRTDIKLYNCSRDGEPETEIDMKFVGAVEDPKGDTDIEKKVKQFIEEWKQKYVTS